MVVKHLCDMLHKGLGTQPFYHRTEQRGSGDEIRVTSFMVYPYPDMMFVALVIQVGVLHIVHRRPSRIAQPLKQRTAGIEPWGFGRQWQDPVTFSVRGTCCLGGGLACSLPVGWIHCGKYN